MRAAIQRKTRAGHVLGEAERLGPLAALNLYLGAFDDPGGRPREIVCGMPADLCLMRAPLRVVLGELSAELVAMTLVGGEPAAGSSRPDSEPVQLRHVELLAIERDH
jgi:hypothetical protein